MPMVIATYPGRWGDMTIGSGDVSRPVTAPEASPQEGSRPSGGLGRALFRGAAGSFALNIANTALTVAVSIVLARALGVSEYGTFAFVTATILLLIVPAVLGVDRLLVRDVAVFSTRSSFDLMRGLVRHATATVTILSVLLAIGVGAVAWFANGRALTPDVAALWIGLLALPLLAIGRVSQATLMGLGQVVKAQVPELLVRPALFLVLVLAVGVLGVSGLDAQTVLWLQVAAVAIGLAMSLFILARAMPQAARSGPTAYLGREWMQSSIELALLSGAAVINAQMGTVLLGTLTTSSDAGLYAVATRGALLISFGLTAVNTALAPTAARLWAQGDIASLQGLVTSSSRGVFVASLPVALVFIFFGSTVLTIFFGAEYAAAGPALAVLSIGQLVNASIGSVGTLLIMTGHQRDAAIGISIGAILQLVLGLLLIPTYGVMGAAVGATASIIVWNVLLAIATARRLGLHSTALGSLGRRARRGAPPAPPGHVPDHDDPTEGGR